VSFLRADVLGCPAGPFWFVPTFSFVGTARGCRMGSCSWNGHGGFQKFFGGKAETNLTIVCESRRTSGSEGRVYASDDSAGVSLVEHAGAAPCNFRQAWPLRGTGVLGGSVAMGRKFGGCKCCSPLRTLAAVSWRSDQKMARAIWHLRCANDPHRKANFQSCIVLPPQTRAGRL